MVFFLFFMDNRGHSGRGASPISDEKTFYRQ